MTIAEIHKSSADYTDLKQFVEKHNLLFNSPLWLNVYPEQNIRQCAIKNKNNEIIGCFIYFRFKKTGVTFLITPPFSPNSALFYLNPAESVVGKNSFDKEVSMLLADYFESLRVPYINLYLPYHAVDTQPFTWKGFISKTRYSYLIDLHQAEEAIWNNLSSEKRKSLNKARKDGLEVKETNDYQSVFTLIMQSLERNDKDRNEQVIKNILFGFANNKNSITYLAYSNGKAIGASFCVVDRNRAVYIFGGFDSDNKHHGAGVSCMWNSILTAKARGMEIFDFEGSMNISIERYFREFGGELTPYFCVEKIKPWLKTPLKWLGHSTM